MAIRIVHGDHKFFTTFKTYINHKVLEISGNGQYCSKESLKMFRADCPADCSAAEMYMTDERKMAAPPSKR
jgi:hypothetical protein